MVYKRLSFQIHIVIILVRMLLRHWDKSQKFRWNFQESRSLTDFSPRRAAGVRHDRRDGIPVKGDRRRQREGFGIEGRGPESSHRLN
jgi:hypothetical protein